MQASVNINTILKNVSSLPIEDRFYITDIISKRISEKRREDIFQRAKEAENNYQNNKVSIGNPHDLFKVIEND